MRDKELAIGIASIFVGLGGGGVLGWLGQTAAALVVSILFLIIGIGWLIYAWKLKGKRQIGQFSRKDQAYKELAELVKLGQELWGVKEQVQKRQDPFKNEKVKDIFMRIQTVRCLPENQMIGDFLLEEKFDALIEIYRRFVEFHFPMYSREMLAASDQLYAWIKEYIRRNIKD